MTATAINTLAQDELCSLQTQLRARLRVSACLCRGLYAGCLRAGVSGLLTLKKLTRELRRERQAPSESTRRLPRTSASTVGWHSDCLQMLSPACCVFFFSFPFTVSRVQGVGLRREWPSKTQVGGTIDTECSPCACHFDTVDRVRVCLDVLHFAPIVNHPEISLWILNGWPANWL